MGITWMLFWRKKKHSIITLPLHQVCGRALFSASCFYLNTNDIFISRSSIRLLAYNFVVNGKISSEHEIFFGAGLFLK